MSDAFRELWEKEDDNYWKSYLNNMTKLEEEIGNALFPGYGQSDWTHEQACKRAADVAKKL